MKEETVLYMRDNNGAMREWAISAIENLITIRHGQVLGSMQYQQEYVATGLASRSLEEQVQSRIDSRISKQRDKGYISDYVIATNVKASNRLGMPKPMLAHKLRDVKNIDFENAICQPKFDGNRCLIYVEDGITKAYSRNGKEVLAIDHILDDIVLPEGAVVDGELYCHGYPLQTIVSWIKRKQENTLKLKYHLYDVISPDPYELRQLMIKSISHGDHVIPVPGTEVQSLEEVMMMFHRYRDEGYEGAIVRWGDTGYEDGKRSKSLVKVKSWEDDEFPVVAVHSSRDGWGILECELPDGNTFRVSAPGSMPEKINILANKLDYIGQDVTVEFANYTKDGIPFHPVAILFNKHVL